MIRHSLRVGVDAAPLADPLTGVGNYILAVLKAIKAVRPDVEFMLYSNRELSAETTSIGEVQISSGRSLPGPIWMNTQLRCAIDRVPLDVFWFTNGYMPLAMPKRLPSVVTVHDLTYRLAPMTMRPISRMWRRVLQPSAVWRASRLVAVSRATASDIEHFDGRRPDAIVHPLVSPIFAPPSASTIAGIRRAYSLPAMFMLSLGTQEPRKNLESLVQAVLRLSDQGIDVPLLVLAGGRGWQDVTLREAIVEGERRGVVRSLGYLDRHDLPGLYGSASLFILASVYEGFGMPVLEAQRCGTAVAISNIPALVEAAGGHALTFQPTVDGIASLLSGWIDGGLIAPLRPASTLVDQSELAAAAMLAEFEYAIHARDINW